MLTGGVFRKTPEELNDIVKICKNNNIKITGSIFLKSYSELNETISFIKTNYDESYLLSLIINKNVCHLKETFSYLDELGALSVVKNSAAILTLSLDEIKERKKAIIELGEPLVTEKGKFNSIFGMSKKNYELKYKTKTL